MGLRNLMSPGAIANAAYDEKVAALRNFYGRQPLLNNGTFTRGTVAGLGAGTVGTIALLVPADQIWFLKKILVGTSSDAGGTSYPTVLTIDGVAAGTLGNIVCDTVYGDLLVCTGSVVLTGTFGSVGTFLGTINLSVEGHYTNRFGYSTNT